MILKHFRMYSVKNKMNIQIYSRNYGQTLIMMI